MSSSSSSSKDTYGKKDLQRRIFLNTMRSVYPDSIQIKYVWSDDDMSYILKPISVLKKCKDMEDKTWGDLMNQLNDIFLKHINVRNKVVPCAWLVLAVIAALYLAIGFASNSFSSVAYLVAGPIVFMFLCVLIPNTCYTMLAVKPLFKDFENWKRTCISKFDKAGIEVIRITTGGLLSDRSPYRVLGAIYYGSGVWFRYQDCAIEIFWRSIKSSKRVRRYSLMIQTSALVNNNDDQDDVNPRSDPTVNEHRLTETIDESLSISTLDLTAEQV